MQATAMDGYELCRHKHKQSVSKVTLEPGLHQLDLVIPVCTSPLGPCPWMLVESPEWLAADLY